jgi:hypothetical protein
MYLVDTQARFNPRCYRVGPTTGPAARPAPVVSDVGLTSLCTCTGISLPVVPRNEKKIPRKRTKDIFRANALRYMFCGMKGKATSDMMPMLTMKNEERHAMIVCVKKQTFALRHDAHDTSGFCGFRVPVFNSIRTMIIRIKYERSATLALTGWRGAKQRRMRQ